jgi:UDP-N-acetylmuramoylalanine--D-glutamate ligase
MNITVIGAGKSGIAAALLAKQDGNSVFVTESKEQSSYIGAYEQLGESSIDVEFGGHSSKALQNCKQIIVSPGVPPSSPIIQEAESLGIPIVSELEFASLHTTNPIISITGTNGKTTTTALTEFILKQSGKSAIAAGNIGIPLSSLVGKVSPETIFVLETSSYQLDRTYTFKPKVSIILNITPDHLGYHGTMENYCKAKWKTSQNQNADDLLILNADNFEAAACSKISKTNVAYISINPLQQGAYTSHSHLILASHPHKEEVLMQLDEIRLPGVHNRYNSMAAILAARAFEVRNENIRDSLMQFSGVEHRLEFVRSLNSINYVNDSKATNINATWYALSSYSTPIVWIVGGLSDNNDYANLEQLIASNVRSIIAIGEDKEKIFDMYCSKIRCVKANSLEDAVSIASKEAKSGDTILFSPACKSFDMFANYEHRGLVFKQAVMSL